MGTTENNIIDLDLSALRKKRIRIDGDDNKIIEINTSDMGVMGRLDKAYDKLIDLANKYHVTEDNDGEGDNDDPKIIIEALSAINKEMNNLIDYIFDAPISEICCDGGTMADPFNGQFRFEYIIEKFIDLYDDNFSREFKQLSKNVKKHTDKYVRK